MTFAVGLREDAANAEYYVKKILPMSFYEPGKPVEKRARAPPKDAPPVEALDVPELVEMRQRLRDVLRGCEKMEREEKQCAAELQAATDRLATVEKRSAQLDDQLDQYDEQLAEERNRTLAASMDAEQTRAQHAELLEQVERGERAVARLEAELADKEAQLRALEACSDLELVFGRRDDEPDGAERVLRDEVSGLDAWRQPPAKLAKRHLQMAANASRPCVEARRRRDGRRDVTGVDWLGSTPPEDPRAKAHAAAKAFMRSPHCKEGGPGWL